MNPNVKKWVSSVVIASVVWSGATWTTQTASAAATPFSDVVAGHWAEKHIAKLALQGILKGSNGKFNPNNSVSRQEAVIIALRFMGLEDEVDSSAATVIPAALNVKTDYTKYINLALQKKLLLIGEETALAKSEPGKSWGASPATREWMAKLLVRAIGKDADAVAAADQVTSFADDSKIDAKLKAYVKVAVDNGLVNGVTTTVKGATVTEFKPVDLVTRATASTLFSRAESKISVPYNGQVEGVLLNITADKLTLLHPDGSTRDYPITDNTAYYRKDVDTPITLGALRLYGKALLITGSDGKVGYAEMTDETPQVKTVEGKLTLYTPPKYQFALLIGDEYKYYTYDPSRVPTITDAAGQPISLANLPLNVDVKLTVRADDKVVALTVKQTIINKTGSGTVSAWNPQALSLEVKDATGKAETFPVASNAPIKLNGTVNLSVDQLLVSDTISYEVKNGNVTSIIVVRADKPITSVSGTLATINKTDNSIQYTAESKLEAEYLSENVAVKIQGFVDPTLDDLVKGDAVMLTLDNNRKVTLITVTNRSVTTLVGATIGSYVASEKTLIVYDTAGVKYNLDINAGTRFDLNGTKVTLEAAIPYISVKGKRLTVGFSGTNAIYVSVVSKYTGTVTENNAVTKTLKLALETGGSISFPYTSPLVEIYGMNSETTADVKAGDRVTILMNAMQDQVGSVLVYKNAQFEVVSTDSTLKKITLKIPGSTTNETYTLNSDFTIQDDSGTAITLGSLAAGSLVNVKMQGNTPVAIRAVAVVSGKVVSVNSSLGSITYTSSTGEAVTKTVGASPLVKRDNVTLASMAVIQPGDLIEISKDENDRAVIELATVVNRTFWKVDAITKVFYVKNVTMGDKNYFTISPTAYVHQGATTISITALKDGDAITLYVLRGKVVEIAK
ncbi:S-layer homology domain-containing protein [Cohnella yongneupensis]|uniref:S-layer homology domain-containing protein n=1 Tax=Cohnella yongneupensis TaxID=425006 RepID=A0ABW0R5M3_9BACL